MCTLQVGEAGTRFPQGLLQQGTWEGPCCLAHAESRQTDTSTAAKLDGTHQCRVRGTVHQPTARALSSLPREGLPHFIEVFWA